MANLPVWKSMASQLGASTTALNVPVTACHWRPNAEPHEGSKA